MTPALFAGFLESATKMPKRPALWVEGQLVPYGHLLQTGSRIAATLQRHVHTGAPILTAVLAERSYTGFAGILGALLAGHGYVPLNVSFPIARTRAMLQQSSSHALIVDNAGEAQLPALLEQIDRSLVLVLPERPHVTDLQRRWPRHFFVGASELAPAAEWREPKADPDGVAYLLFTSGSTGVPKGVAIGHASIVHFIEAMVERYQIAPVDRFSQMFDTTFDLSLFDLFVAWRAGACVYCPSRATLLNPSQFVRDHELTVWFSVPTIAMLMQRIGSLTPAQFPSLRWSLFCGEPLPASLAEAWLDAAPESVLENLYGPTELTIACTAYRWDRRRSNGECHGGLVPIGLPLPGMQMRVVDDAFRDVAPGTVGELLVAGPQRANGYWRDDEATARSFVRLDGDGETFYRTGDRVRRPLDSRPICYVGRIDHQIKVLGHRVELDEVESILRQAPGVDQAVAVGWPLTSTGTAGIAAFVTGRNIDVVALRDNVRQKLQSYAVPHIIEVVAMLPQNANGKVDRQALLGRLAG